VGRKFRGTKVSGKNRSERRGRENFCPKGDSPLVGKKAGGRAGGRMGGGRKGHFRGGLLLKSKWEKNHLRGGFRGVWPGPPPPHPQKRCSHFLSEKAGFRPRGGRGVEGGGNFFFCFQLGGGRGGGRKTRGWAGGPTHVGGKKKKPVFYFPFCKGAPGPESVKKKKKKKKNKKNPGICMRGGGPRAGAGEAGKRGGGGRGGDPFSAHRGDPGGRGFRKRGRGFR